MKRNFILFVLIISMIYFFNACKESGTTETEAGPIVADASYYPVNEGTSYKYNVERTDSTGGKTTGVRFTEYVGTQVIANVAYQMQIDSINISGQASTSQSYFRKTDSGVFFFLDTTGLSVSTPELIPYLQYLTIDSEMRLLFFPVSDNSTWTVFKMNINTEGLSFNPVEVTTTYDGQEIFNLNSVGTNVETVRLKFTLKYQTNPFTTPQNFIAYGWIAEDIGFVKWEGSGTIIGAFTGNGVDFADTSSVVLMNITEFDVN